MKNLCTLKIKNVTPINLKKVASIIYDNEFETKESKI